MLKEKSFFINSILLGIILATKIISMSLDNFQITTISVVLISILLFVINFKFRINVKYLISDSLIFIIGLIIYFNWQIFGNNYYLGRNLNFFIYYGIFAYMILQHKFNIKIVINTIIIIYMIFGIPFIMHNFDLYLTGDLMAVSYDILPLFLAIIIKFVALKEKFTWKHLICFIFLLPYIYFLLVYCSRGVYLAIILCILLCKIVKGIGQKQLLIFCIIICIVMILLINIVPILTSINNFLNSHNMSFKIIEKNLRLLKEGDVSNGRENLYPIAIDGINRSFVIGNGIGSFNLKYNTYPHNFILQIMYEGGILFLIPIIVPVIYGLYAIVSQKNISKNMRILIIFLFCASIIRLLISYEFWKEMFFWMYLSVSVLAMLNKDIMLNKEYNNGNSNNTNI